MKNAGPSISADSDPGHLPPKPGRSLLVRYTGLAARYLTLLGCMVWLGLKADRWLLWQFPICVWLFPLLALAGLTVKAILDTSNPRS